MYVELEQIGEGAFGRVAKIRRTEDAKILVWKEIFFGSMSEKEKQMLVDEVNLMREFVHHPNIVRYYDRVIDRENKRIYIVMEYCSGGDLAAAIKCQKLQRRYFEEGFLWSVLRQVASALEVCHERSSGAILHRDLKPNNILLDVSHSLVKLGDFGLAKVLQPESRFARSHVGTPTYMSPEQIRETRYDMSSDIWSLGCLMYEMASLQPPFRAKNQLALAKKITAGQFDPVPRHYSRQLIDLIESMLAIKPKNRPSITAVLRQCRDWEQEDRPKEVDDFDSVRDKLECVREAEERLLARENAILERERDLRELERSLRRKSAEFAARSRDLDNRERELSIRERRVREDRERSPRQPVEKEFVTPKMLHRTLSRLPRPATEGSCRVLQQTSTNALRFDRDAVLARLNSASSMENRRHHCDLDFTPRKLTGGLENQLPLIKPHHRSTARLR